MANSITKTGGAAKKRDERRPAEKVGGLSLPATVQQPSLRPLPRIPGTAEESPTRATRSCATKARSRSSRPCGTPRRATTAAMTSRSARSTTS